MCANICTVRKIKMLLILSTIGRYVVTAYCSFNLHFPIDYDVEDLFMCLFSTFTSILVKSHLFYSLKNYLSSYCVVSVLLCYGYSPLSDISQFNPVSQSVSQSVQYLSRV